MILFKKVRYKNFLSTGNQFIEIDLDKSNTTLVVGENGAGKSTMLDALCFGLFQRAFRGIKKDQLVNSINEKDAYYKKRIQKKSFFYHLLSMSDARRFTNFPAYRTLVSLSFFCFDNYFCSVIYLYFRGRCYTKFSKIYPFCNFDVLAI